MPGQAAVCLASGKKFKQSEYSIQCTVCVLWIHKSCVNISDEHINFLDTQHKETGMAYWACRPCTAYTQGMNPRMKEIESKLEDVKKSCKTNEGDIRRVEDDVKRLTETVERQASD
jgi:hypothetical protein